MLWETFAREGKQKLSYYFLTLKTNPFPPCSASTCSHQNLQYYNCWYGIPNCNCSLFVHTLTHVFIVLKYQKQDRVLPVRGVPNTASVPLPHLPFFIILYWPWSGREEPGGAGLPPALVLPLFLSAWSFWCGKCMVSPLNRWSGVEGGTGPPASWPGRWERLGWGEGWTGSFPSSPKGLGGPLSRWSGGGSGHLPSLTHTEWKHYLLSYFVGGRWTSHRDVAKNYAELLSNIRTQDYVHLSDYFPL